MKSFCIKTNSQKVVQYLLSALNFPNTYVSIRKFKIYDNIIIHYTGEDISGFYNNFANSIVHLTIDLYEKRLLNSIIKSNYFYFSESEQKCVRKIKVT